MTEVTPTGHSSEVYDPWLFRNHWAASSLTYSFPTDGSFVSYRDTDAVAALSASQQDAVRSVLAEVASFTGLTFIEVTESATTEATLRFASEAGLSGAYAYLPSDNEIGGDSFYGSGTESPVIGNEARLFFSHEIGHVLGLEHGHDFPSFSASGFDSQEYTVVTYTDYVGDTDTFSYDSGPIDWAQSFQQLDIAALQFLYGANYSDTGEVWSGDTVYTFSATTGEMSINGVGQGLPAGNRIFRSIWDGNGTDTYDLSNYAADLDIDLAPGAFSTFATAQLADLNRFDPDPSYLAAGNVANARLVGGDRRALIENATGGSGDDTLAGNMADNTLRGNSGRDVLHGRWGDDWLYGGAGDDTLVGHGRRDVLLGHSGNDRLIGGDDDDRLNGGADDDSLVGGAGQDRLLGRDGSDVLRGGAGDDILNGGGGGDRLFGDAGSDRFRFTRADDSAAGIGIDRIADFESGVDRLDVAELVPGTFTLALGGDFSGSGPSLITQEVAGNTCVFADIDGDASADFRVDIVNAVGLTADDFIL